MILNIYIYSIYTYSYIHEYILRSWPESAFQGFGSVLRLHAPRLTTVKQVIITGRRDDFATACEKALKGEEMGGEVCSLFQVKQVDDPHWIINRQINMWFVFFPGMLSTAVYWIELGKTCDKIIKTSTCADWGWICFQAWHIWLRDEFSLPAHFLSLCYWNTKLYAFLQ